MSIDIKENAQILGKAVKNCNSFDTMIVTLIPFLLAARLESPNLLLWKHGAEVTYLVQNHATTHHSGDSNSINMNFDLRAMMSCQKSNSSVFCHFHDVRINSTPQDVNHPKPRKYMVEDLWTKKILQESFLEIAYEKNGTGQVWIPAEVNVIGRNMINTLGRHLIVGVDLSIRQYGKFESASDVTNGECRTKYFVTQSPPPLNNKSSIMNLFLIPRQDKSLASPLEIAKVVDDPECADRANFYSFWAARELRKVDPMDAKPKLNSAENYMVMKNHNITSFSKIKSTIENYKDNTKYIIDESISLSLQNIHSAECPLCAVDDSKSHEDNSSEEKNVFVE